MIEQETVEGKHEKVNESLIAFLKSVLPRLEAIAVVAYSKKVVGSTKKKLRELVEKIETQLNNQDVEVEITINTFKKMLYSLYANRSLSRPLKEEVLKICNVIDVRYSISLDVPDCVHKEYYDLSEYVNIIRNILNCLGYLNLELPKIYSALAYIFEGECLIAKREGFAEIKNLLELLYKNISSECVSVVELSFGVRKFRETLGLLVLEIWGVEQELGKKGLVEDVRQIKEIRTRITEIIDARSGVEGEHISSHCALEDLEVLHSTAKEIHSVLMSIEDNHCLAEVRPELIKINNLFDGILAETNCNSRLLVDINFVTEDFREALNLLILTLYNIEQAYKVRDLSENANEVNEIRSKITEIINARPELTSVEE